MLLIRDQRKHQRILKETEPEYPGRSLKDNFTEEKFLQIKPAVGVYSFVSSRNSFKGIIEIIPVQTFMGR